jgi:hypothetical protein
MQLSCNVHSNHVFYMNRVTKYMRIEYTRLMHARLRSSYQFVCARNKTALRQVQHETCKVVAPTAKPESYGVILLQVL